MDVPFLPLTTLCTKRTSPLFICQTRQDCIRRIRRCRFSLFLDFLRFSTPRRHTIPSADSGTAACLLACCRRHPAKADFCGNRPPRSTLKEANSSILLTSCCGGSGHASSFECLPRSPRALPLCLSTRQEPILAGALNLPASPLSRLRAATIWTFRGSAAHETKHELLPSDLALQVSPRHHLPARSPATSFFDATALSQKRPRATTAASGSRLLSVVALGPSTSPPFATRMDTTYR